MGVAPEAIVEEFFFEYRLKYDVLNYLTFNSKQLDDNIIGSELSAQYLSGIVSRN
jgi:hypothetical protein